MKMGEREGGREARREGGREGHTWSTDKFVPRDENGVLPKVQGLAVGVEAAHGVHVHLKGEKEGGREGGRKWVVRRGHGGWQKGGRERGRKYLEIGSSSRIVPESQCAVFV